jgi:hypothetical protein
MKELQSKRNDSGTRNGMNYPAGMVMFQTPTATNFRTTPPNGSVDLTHKK